MYVFNPKKGKNIIISFDKLWESKKMSVRIAECLTHDQMYHWTHSTCLTMSGNKDWISCACGHQWARRSRRWASSRPSVRATSTCTGAPGSSAACLTPTRSSTPARYRADVLITLNSAHSFTVHSFTGHYGVCGGLGYLAQGCLRGSTEDTVDQK